MFLLSIELVKKRTSGKNFRLYTEGSLCANTGRSFEGKSEFHML